MRKYIWPLIILAVAGWLAYGRINGGACGTGGYCPFSGGAATASSEKAVAPENTVSTPKSSTQISTMTEKSSLRDKLTPTQYAVACEGSTEPPFRNAYWDNHQPGLYVDVISGKPLFASVDKFDSGTGWPSFTQPVDEEEVVEVRDTSHGMVRTEVRSKSGDAHLGHVFPDGPGESGLRYCINSASLRFIPVADLEKEGYGEYAKLFKGDPGQEKPQE